LLPLSLESSTFLAHIKKPKGKLWFYQKSTLFWDITPCSPLKVNRHFGGIYCLHLQGRRKSRARNQHESRWGAESFSLPLAFMLICCSSYSSTLKMEAICSSEMSVDFQWSTRRYILEDSTLHNHRCENLKGRT
jgi:hypothetical protein